MSDILIREEQEIARKYLFNDTWIYVFWGIGNFLVWLSLWPLAFMNILPLWIIFIIATLNCCLAYLPSHEAQHGNIVKRSSPYFWVNELVGYISVLPLLTGYKLLKETHMLHHKHTNDPEKEFSWSNIIVVPSIKPEPFGRVAIEAMSIGRCVVAANHGGLKEIISHKINGVLFEHNNVDSLITELNNIMHNPEYILKYGLNGKITFDENFSREVYEQTVVSRESS